MNGFYWRQWWLILNWKLRKSVGVEINMLWENIKLDNICSQAKSKSFFHKNFICRTDKRWILNFLELTFYIEWYAFLGFLNFCILFLDEFWNFIIERWYLRWASNVLILFSVFSRIRYCPHFVCPSVCRPRYYFSWGCPIGAIYGSIDSLWPKDLNDGRIFLDRSWTRWEGSEVQIPYIFIKMLYLIGI